MDENNNVGDRQWLKFGILAGILLITVLVIALLRPIIFGRIVPAVMGGDGEKTAVDETIIEETIVPVDDTTDTEVFIPVVSDDTDTNGETTVTDEPMDAADDGEEPVVDENSEEPVVDEAGEETAVNTITYTVVAGDSIYSIARAYNLNPETIVILNNIPDPNNILIGTELLIPQP